MRRSRPYVQLDPAVIEQARQMDLLSYLRAYEPKVLLLPPKSKDCSRVMQYLFGRGIDYQLIQECITDGTIYESAIITTPFLWARIKAERQSMPPCAVRSEAPLSRTLREVTSDIRSDCLQKSR